MKLLLDQNLSYRIIEKIEKCFPSSAHVKNFGLSEACDSKIWTFAAENAFIIATKDNDFLNRSLLLGHPPKVIHIQAGNSSTQEIVDILLENFDLIDRFRRSKRHSLLILK